MQKQNNAPHAPQGSPSAATLPTVAKINKTFSKSVVGGYNPEEVHAYLIEMQQYVQQLIHDNQELQKKLVLITEKLVEYRTQEESLKAAVFNAQKFGDNLMHHAKREADQMIKDANLKAKIIVDKAEVVVDKQQKAMLDMQKDTGTFIKQQMALYQQQIELLKALSDPQKSTQETAPHQNTVTGDKGQE